MAVVTGPVLSIGARGKIAKSIVFATWRGVKYARQYVVPANPKTVAQLAVRTTFAAIDATYKRLLALSQAPWEAAAVGMPFVARNKLISVNLPLLRGQADKSAFVASPGVGGGLPAVSLAAAATASAGELTLTASFPTAPLGWTMTGITAQALENVAPNIAPVGTVFEQSDLPGAYPVTLAGLTSGQAYVVSIWPVWVRSDGKTVYGPSLSAVATPL